MENLVFTQLSVPEIRQLFRQELQSYFEQYGTPTEVSTIADEILTVQQAADFLSITVSTVYGLIHRGELPVMKRSKRCYFSKAELINYLKQGRKKTLTETANEAEQYLTKKKKGVSRV